MDNKSTMSATNIPGRISRACMSLRCMPSEHIYELLKYMLAKYIHVSQNLGLTAHKIGYREEEKLKGRKKEY